MKAKTHVLICSLIMGSITLLGISCRKDAGLPELLTADVNSIKQTTANCGGTIVSDNDFEISERGVCWNTSGDPTISDNKTTDGTGTGSFTSKLSGLNFGTTYYLRAYATNSKGTGYGNIKEFQTIGTNFTDPRDGAVYKIITIGDQVWMAENLKYLPSVSEPTFGSATEPYYYVYDYYGKIVTAAKATTNYATYGVLYNWPAALSASPAGWHLPSFDEWLQLINYLGNESVAGGELKESGILHWFSPNYLATNNSGFTALPGGCRDNGIFHLITFNGYWWTCTDAGSQSAYYRGISNADCNIFNAVCTRELGLSVRCVLD